MIINGHHCLPMWYLQGTSNKPFCVTSLSLYLCLSWRLPWTYAVLRRSLLEAHGEISTMKYRNWYMKKNDKVILENSNSRERKELLFENVVTLFLVLSLLFQYLKVWSKVKYPCYAFLPDLKIVWRLVCNDFDNTNLYSRLISILNFSQIIWSLYALYRGDMMVLLDMNDLVNLDRSYYD